MFIPPSQDQLIVELVATLDSLVEYSSSRYVATKARERREELMQYKHSSPPPIDKQVAIANNISVEAARNKILIKDKEV